MKILIVEDELIIAESMKIQLETGGHQVAAVCDTGLKALASVETTRPDIILMDVKLKGTLNGIGTAEKIMEKYDIPIIFMTAYGDTETIENARKSGAYGILSKPLDANTLKATLELTVTRHGFTKKLENRERKLNHLNSALRALGNVNQLIAKTNNPKVLLRKVGDSLVQPLGYFRVWIALLDNDGELVDFVSAGSKEGDPDMGEFMKKVLNIGCFRKAWEESGVTALDGVNSECRTCSYSTDSVEYCRFSKKIAYQDHTYGVLSASIPMEFASDPQEKQLFSELTDDLAFALHKIEVEEARDKAEKELEQMDQQLRNIIEHSTNVFYTHNTKHILTYVSPQCESVLGYRPEEVMIRWTDLITDNPLNNKGLEITNRAIKTGEIQPPYELELRHKSGKGIRVEVREAPVVKNGKTVAVVGSLTDISGRMEPDKKK